MVAPKLSSRSSDAPLEDALPLSYYTSYDLICCIQDIPTATTSLYSAKSMAVAASFFTGCILLSLVGGFGMKVAMNSRKYREGMATLQQQTAARLRAGEKLEDPMVLATRALGWGTLYAIIGSGAVGLTTLYFLKM